MFARIALSLLLAVAVLPVEAALLVVDGRPAAVIVVADRPTISAQIAARELQAHVKAATGAELPIVSESEVASGEDTRVYVGGTKAAAARGWTPQSFEPQEVFIHIGEREIFLLGRDEERYDRINYDSVDLAPGIRMEPYTPFLYTERGTAEAAWTFLERYMGVRWFMPVEPGIVIPKRETLRLEPTTFRQKPWTTLRGPLGGVLFWDPWTFHGSGRERREIDSRAIAWWLLRNRAGGRLFMVTHSFTDYYQRFGKAHPEWWGSNTPSPTAHLEYLHPGVLEQAARDARDFFDGRLKVTHLSHGHAGGGYFGVVPNDTSYGWSVTPYSEELQNNPVPVPDPAPPASAFWNGNKSRYIWALVNHVAQEVGKTHPQEKISAVAYARYTLRPPELKLEPNVALCVCRTAAMYSPQPGNREYFRKILEDWRTQTEEVYVWEYYIHQMVVSPQFEAFPFVTPKQIGEELKWLRDQGIRGYRYELGQFRAPHKDSGQIRGQGVPNIVEQMLPIYVTQKMLINADLSPDGLVDDFCNSMFGPAAKPMKAFFEEIEASYTDPSNWDPRIQGTEYQWWRLMANSERIAAWRQLFDNAYALAPEEPYRTRVRLMDEALLGPITMYARRYEARRKSRPRLELGKGASITIGPDITGSVSYQDGRLEIELRGLPSTWQSVDVAFDPSRRRAQIVHVEARNGQKTALLDGSASATISVTHSGNVLRIVIPDSAWPEPPQPGALWGADILVNLDAGTPPMRWAPAAAPALDPRGFGIWLF